MPTLASTSTSAPTPLPTKAALVATLALTGLAVGAYVASGPKTLQPVDVAPYLYFLTGLFVLRVVGQVLVRARQPRWLPPTEQWNLTPYRVLLPSQAGILGLMLWINMDFARGDGFWTKPRHALGVGVLWFVVVYAGAMTVRYVVQMTRRVELRWFGGAIPIVFHGVLASYLFLFGSYHASH